MREPAVCSACRHVFEAPAELAGAITNCPRCGKAVELPGLRDPLWRLWQVGMLLAAAAVGALVAGAHGAGPGIGAGVVVAGVLWLISRAF